MIIIFSILITLLSGHYDLQSSKYKKGFTDSGSHFKQLVIVLHYIQLGLQSIHFLFLTIDTSL